MDLIKAKRKLPSAQSERACIEGRSSQAPVQVRQNTTVELWNMLKCQVFNSHLASVMQSMFSVPG